MCEVPDFFLINVRAKRFDVVCSHKDWDKYKDIIFSWACGNTDETTVRFLLTKDVNPAYKKDWPLYNACRNGQVEIVKLLLTYTSVCKYATANKNRSLLVAECEEYDSIVDMLKQLEHIGSGPSITKPFFGFDDY